MYCLFKVVDKETIAVIKGVVEGPLEPLLEEQQSATVRRRSSMFPAEDENFRPAYIDEQQLINDNLRRCSED